MIYTGNSLKEISFPLGGIGTGSIGLSENGNLIDWEIFNRPSKGSDNDYSHFAIRCKDKDGSVKAFALNGDTTQSLMGSLNGSLYSSFGFGPSKCLMSGFPHFRSITFNGEFPIAEINFSDDNFPLDVTLRAFNPFIPLDADNSSIPAAFFELEYKNNTKEDFEFSAALSLCNHNKIGKNTKKPFGVFLESLEDSESVTYSDLTAMCDCENTTVQEYWYRGGWMDPIVTFWNEFSSGNPLSERHYENSTSKIEPSMAGGKDTATVMGTRTIKSGETHKMRFILSWNAPNNYNYWNECKNEDGSHKTWKNYYKTKFENSYETAKYCLENWDDLYNRTDKFRKALYSSSLDKSVIDAAAANLSVLKSPTVLRLEDGTFYGWEGVHPQEGSCEGTCQHVWNYAYALCFLFPELEKSIRDMELKFNTSEDGEMQFRLALPYGREQEKFRACLDGQMGTVIKIYRDWRITGDNRWIKDNWQNIKNIASYAWSDKNPDEWDRNKDGVLEGRQHHTLDMELFGPSSWLEGFYLAALKAAAEMAKFVGDSEFYKECCTLFEKGQKWANENLFNGKYFIQKVDLKDKSIVDHFNCPNYWNEEACEIKYQIGEGSSIDQLCAQWHADISGLGDIFDKGKVNTALENMFKNNFKETMRNHVNPWRVFSLNDEAGSVICVYPEGSNKPFIPVPYCEETMTGFEYSFAGILATRGYVKEGTKVAKAVRDRFSGHNRNPWNEFECGSNYARSMASFALIPIFSGFIFDLPHNTIGFNPITKGDFNSFWSVGTGWGDFKKTDDKLTINIFEGALTLEKINLPFLNTVKAVTSDKESIPFAFENGTITFDKLKASNKIEITF